MRTRRIDRNNDWMFGAGRQSYAAKSDAVRQKVLTRLQSFRNDWFLDLDAGIDWLPMMESRDGDGITSAVRTTVLQTKGVARLTAIESSFDARRRKMKVSVSYIDIYGIASEVNI
jgi:hypothetical protein